MQKRVDILVKSLEKEIIDAKNGKLVPGGQVNSKRKPDKKRGENSTFNVEEDIDEDMDEVDQPGVGPMEDFNDIDMDEDDNKKE